MGKLVRSSYGYLNVALPSTYKGSFEGFLVGTRVTQPHVCDLILGHPIAACTSIATSVSHYRLRFHLTMTDLDAQQRYNSDIEP